ncbi:thiaminase II [Sansalvadorimonas sp. 2012CJ34-2]|uniref:Aminopyrimidine aminohydrolase n=1 Tax=Parendozoicomonas callyspongiae TaxID=2942213 RepID=A0ABT0PKL0_9GAMM|nr:thiaminase II [Sansalvadorimonas sp. 2012CJ34-2]MCL6271932.1 thiaminase II [Sansalvadorimonas sp. 2012CJ34-2]
MLKTSDLISSCQNDWDAYTRHRFVCELGNGTLPEGAFRHYLQQDYLFLTHFARAYALAIYKCDNFADMRYPLTSLQGTLDTEITLHIDFCKKWGLTETDMMAIPEATGTVAYTRLVLDAGQSGSLVELYAAMAPCAIGYADIGQWLINKSDTVFDGNPYREWIDMYGNDEMQEAGNNCAAQLDAMMRDIPKDSAAANRIKKIFRDAVRMEIAFWEQGYQDA